MKNYLVMILLIGSISAYAQTETHESFTKDEELKSAFLKLDMAPFVGADPVNFIYVDSLDKTVRSAASLNTLMKLYIVVPKNATIKKASETNNGYVQSYGIYNREGDALMYVRFTLNALSSKLEEVSIEDNN